MMHQEPTKAPRWFFRCGQPEALTGLELGRSPTFGDVGLSEQFADYDRVPPPNAATRSEPLLGQRLGAAEEGAFGLWQRYL
jgi:hypothetical protein